MRLPKSSEMKDLSKLSGIREKAAMLELSEVAARRQIALDRVNELRGDLPKTETVEEGLALQRWLVWREREIKQRLSTLAIVSAEYAKTAQQCGRVIAENAVVEEMSKLAKIDANEIREKRCAYSQMATSHFLANNICDQDI